MARTFSFDANQKDDTCGKCKFWAVQRALPASNVAGRCRINPPTFHTDGPYGDWPLTFESDWCGKYEATDA